MIKVPFTVKMSPYPHINRMMRQADLMREGEGAFITCVIELSWKDGELVDNKRVKKAAESLKESLEELHYEVLYISLYGEVLVGDSKFKDVKNG